MLDALRGVDEPRVHEPKKAGRGVSLELFCIGAWLQGLDGMQRMDHAMRCDSCRFRYLDRGI